MGKIRAVKRRVVGASFKTASLLFKKSDAPAPSGLPTVLVVGHKLNFVQPLVAYLKRSFVAEVVVQKTLGHRMRDVDISVAKRNLKVVDVIFCEWCLENAVWFSHNKMPKQRLFIRLHAQEMKLPFLSQINWQNVECLITISPLNAARLKEMFPQHADKIRLLYNLFDTFQFQQPKEPDARFNIGMIGMVPWMKRPDLAVRLISELRELDPRYKLRIASIDPREIPWMLSRKEEITCYNEFFQSILSSELCHAVQYDGHCQDIPTWLRQIGFVISTSDHESFHQAVAEGMASSAVPAILNWSGSEEYYPQKYIRSSVEDLAREVIHPICVSSWQTEGETCRKLAEKFSTNVLGPKYVDRLRLSPQSIERKIDLDIQPLT